MTACKTDLGTLSASALYAGKWDDSECRAHHQDSRAWYFEFTLSADATVSITLSTGTLYVSKDTPKNGWGRVPGPGYEHRRNVRRDNGKLLHDGSANTFSGTGGRRNVHRGGGGRHRRLHSAHRAAVAADGARRATT